MAHESAAAVAFDLAAPQAERTAALAEMQQQHAPRLPSQLIDHEVITGFVDEVRSAYADVALQQALLAKGNMNSTVVPFPSDRMKKREPGMHSVTVDELQVAVMGDYIERPGMLQFESMVQMVEQTPVLGAVVNTRVRQVQRFCRIAESGELPGFEIRHVDREHQLLDSEREGKQLLQKFMANCGWEANALRRKALKRDSLKAFMGKSVRDSLTMDSAPIELEWKKDRGRGLDGFYAVDGSTIRLCTEHGYQGDDEIYALQVVQGRICTAYSFMDMIYEPRNPRTDVRACGYGISEVETLIRVVTGFLNAMTYNMKGFDSNSLPKGILTLVGNYSPQDLAAFKRMWMAQQHGVQNAWGMPLMVAKDEKGIAHFEKLGVEFSEMHFAKWMTFLTSLICAIFGMSPAEINFDSFTGGNTSALAGSDTAEKLAASKDSGLYPLLTHYGDLFTDFIVSQMGDDWCFRWTGLEPDDADKRHELKLKVSTTDEIRAEVGMVAHPDEMMGKAPVDSTAMGLFMQVHQSEIQPAPDMGDPNAGPPGAGGEDDQDPATKPAPGASFGASSSGPGAGDFGDEGDQGFGHTKTGNFGEEGQGGAGDFGADDGGDGQGEPKDFGKAFPTIYSVELP